MKSRKGKAKLKKNVIESVNNERYGNDVAGGVITTIRIKDQDHEESE